MVCKCAWWFTDRWWVLVYMMMFAILGLFVGFGVRGGNSGCFIGINGCFGVLNSLGLWGLLELVGLIVLLLWWFRVITLT